MATDTGEARRPRALSASAAATLAVAIALGVAVFGAVTIVVALASGGVGPLWAAAVAAPPLLAAELVAARAAGRVPRRAASPQARVASRAVDEFAETCLRLRSDQELATALAELLSRHLGLERVALLVVGEGGVWRQLGAAPAEGAAELVIAPPTARALAEIVDVVTASELRSTGDARRRLLAELLAAQSAELLIPLLDRERVLGAITAARGEAAQAPGRDTLAEVQHAAARTLTFLELLQEAERRVGVAREGEVAAAVQQASAPGRREFYGTALSITSFYQPAAAFGGDFFSAAELADGRTLVAIGDVAGRGMPAALISAAVAGAFEAAERLLAPGAPIEEIVAHFNRLVGAVGRDRYAMSCFFALFEPDARAMTFADAGHPFPYVCRQRDGDTELRALVARGVPLGLEAEPRVEVRSTELEEGDAIVLYTDALVEALAPGDDEPYGDRRLRRLLRKRADSSQLCQAIAEDVLEYCGSRPLLDDVTVAVVRIGTSPARPSRLTRP
jgi:serine phosphatase RsbU (regulator of sigma subunit)